MKWSDKNLRSKFFFFYFYHRKSRKYCFSSFFSKKSNIWLQFWKKIVLSFLLRCITFFVAQKLQILEFLIELFFAWILATSATSGGRNFNLIDLNRVSNFCWRCQLSYEILFGGLEWKLGGIRLRFQKWVFNWPKSPGSLGLI